MEKTTVYLPADLKMALKDAASRRGIAEAEIIRESIRAAIATARPRPTAAILDDTEPMAERVDELLAGFGDH